MLLKNILVENPGQLANVIVGMSLQEAEQEANKHYITLRIATIDDTDIPLTSEYVPYRLHIAVKTELDGGQTVTHVYPDFG